MQYDIAKPSEMLRPYIKQYWGMHTAFTPTEAYRQRIIPTGLPELICYFGARPTSTQRNITSNMLFNGQQTDFYDLEINAPLSLFAITFEPLGWHRFFKTPLHLFENQTTDWRLIDTPIWLNLEEFLVEAPSFKQKVALVNKLLLNALAHREKPYDINRIQHAIHIIKQQNGLISIDKLASETCWSRKQFERQFKQMVGIAPKQYLNIVRFQSALYVNQLKPHLSLSELALESYYFDQAHFTKSIKNFTGYTPKQLFSNKGIISDLFT